MVQPGRPGFTRNIVQIELGVRQEIDGGRDFLLFEGPHRNRRFDG